MTPLNFVYWLQGFLEIGQPETLTKEQIQEIKNHIALILKKETPNREDVDNIVFCSPNSTAANAAEAIKKYYFYKQYPPASC